MRALAEVAREINLGQWVLLGRGEESTGGRDKASILADTLEALLGAVWLTGGLERARPVVLGLIGPLLERSIGLGAGLDWKTSVQELSALRGLGTPDYAVTDDGPDHAKTFTAVLLLDGVGYGEGRGPSKKEAEQEAAAAAYRRLVPDLAEDGTFAEFEPEPDAGEYPDLRSRR
jgi:ribonuclease-3